MNDRMLKELGIVWSFGVCEKCGERKRVFDMKEWKEKVREGEFEKVKVCESCFDMKKMFWCVNWNRGMGGDSRDEDLVVKGIFRGNSVKRVRYCKIRVELVNKGLGWVDGKLLLDRESVFWKKEYGKVRSENVEKYFGKVGDSMCEKIKGSKRYKWIKRVVVVEEWVEEFEEKGNWSSGNGGRVLIKGLSEEEEEMYYGRGLIGSESRSEEDKGWKDYE